MVEKIQEWPRVAEAWVEGISQHEDLVAIEAPVAETPEAERQSQDRQGSEQNGSREPVTPSGSLRTHFGRNLSVPEYVIAIWMYFHGHDTLA
jgi:chromatin remodeling complex protein RSC6